jgi:hypothetical protein
MEGREPVLGGVSSSTHLHVVIWFLQKDVRYARLYREEMKTEISAEDLLRHCDPAMFKSYLSWRVRDSRIKKFSAIDGYWKRIGMYYRDVTGIAMGNDVTKDVRAVRYNRPPPCFGSTLTTGKVATKPGA